MYYSLPMKEKLSLNLKLNISFEPMLPNHYLTSSDNSVEHSSLHAASTRQPSEKSNSSIDSINSSNP